MSAHGKYVLNFVRAAKPSCAGCAVLHSAQQCVSTVVALRPPYLAMSVFFSFNSLFNHSNKCVVISLRGFNLHFSNA